MQIPAFFFGPVEEHQDLASAGHDFVVILPAFAPPPIPFQTPVEVDGGHTAPTIAANKGAWITIFACTDINRLGRGAFDCSSLDDRGFAEPFLYGTHESLNWVLLSKSVDTKLYG